MKRSFSKLLGTLVVTLGLSLTVVSGVAFAERAAMAPLPSPSGVDIPPSSVPANPNALANGTQAPKRNHSLRIPPSLQQLIAIPITTSVFQIKSRAY